MYVPPGVEVGAVIPEAMFNKQMESAESETGVFTKYNKLLHFGLKVHPTNGILPMHCIDKKVFFLTLLC